MDARAPFGYASPLGAHTPQTLSRMRDYTAADDAETKMAMVNNALVKKTKEFPPSPKQTNLRPKVSQSVSTKTQKPCMPLLPYMRFL